MLEPLGNLWSWLATLGGAWLLTYLAHSTLLLVGAALWLRLRRSPLAVQELVWRFALVGGLATAAIQGGLGIEPLSSRLVTGASGAAAGPLAIEASAHPAVAATLAQKTVTEKTVAEEAAVLRTTIAGPERALPASTASGAQSQSTVPPERDPRSHAPVLLGSLWSVAALALLLWLALAHVRLRRSLRGRTPITDSALRHTLADLGRRLGLRRPVRLSASATLQSPISCGVLRPEVVLPQRALDELDSHQLEAVLAHELSHLSRRDPLWQLGLRVVEAVFCVQPCNRVVRRRLASIAELRCDELAARLTGRPLDLARSLAQVAGWGAKAPLGAAVAFAARRSNLGRRVERLLGGASRAHERGGWALPVLLLTAVAVAVAPSATLAGRQDPAPPSPPEEAPLPVPLPEEVSPLPPGVFAVPPAPAPSPSSEPTAPSPSAPAPAPAPPAPLTEVRSATRVELAPRVATRIELRQSPPAPRSQTKLRWRAAPRIRLIAPEIRVETAFRTASSPVPPQAPGPEAVASPRPSARVAPPAPLASPLPSPRSASSAAQRSAAQPSAAQPSGEQRRELAAALEVAARTLSSDDASPEHTEAVLRTLQRHLESALGDDAHASRERLLEARLLEQRQVVEARRHEQDAALRELVAAQRAQQEQAQAQLKELVEARAAQEVQAKAELEALLVRARDVQAQGEQVESQEREAAIQRLLQQQLQERERETELAAQAVQRAYEERLRKLEAEYQALLERLESQERPPPNK